MTDDAALGWKLGFGALVLLFSAAVMVTRGKPEPVPVAAPARPAVMPLAPLAQEPASMPVESAEPAPLDVKEEEAPVRVEVSLFDREPARKARKVAVAARPVSRSVKEPVRPIKHSPRRVAPVGEPVWFAPGR